MSAYSFSRQGEGNVSGKIAKVRRIFLPQRLEEKRIKTLIDPARPEGRNQKIIIGSMSLWCKHRRKRD